ncbi:hypothetical protein Q5752_004464 [Cryptotrichosporon argae]
MRLALPFLALLGLSYNTLPAAATQTYAGCQSSSYVSSSLVGSLLTTLTASSNSACRSACANGGYPYSFFTPGTVAALGAACYCGGAGMAPSASALTASTTSAGDCASADYTASVLNSTWTFGGCLSAWTDLGLTSSATVGSISQCLNACAGVGTAFATPNAAGTWGCRCDKTGYSAGTSAVCKAGSGMLYTQTVATSTAGLARRDARPREAGRAGKSVFCPKGMTACRLDPDSDAYECIDPKTELESCGGCAYGEYGADGDVPLLGIDCSALPGTALGATTCTAGTCVASACRAGYSLVDGTCARNRAAAARRRHPDDAVWPDTARGTARAQVVPRLPGLAHRPASDTRA